MSLITFVPESIDISVLVLPSAPYHIDAEYIVEHSFKYNKDLLPNQKFELGTTYSGTIEFTIKGGEDENGVDQAKYFFNKFKNATYENHKVRFSPSEPYGYFYLAEQELDHEGNLKITAYDEMARLSFRTGDDIVELPTNLYLSTHTLQDMIESIGNLFDSGLYTDLTQLPNYDWTGFSNSNITAFRRASLRTILSLCCAMMGCFATCTSNGLEIKQFECDPNKAFTQLTFGGAFESVLTDDFQMGGIVMIMEGTSYSYIADNTKPLLTIYNDLLVNTTNISTRMQNIWDGIKDCPTYLVGWEAKFVADWVTRENDILDFGSSTYRTITKIQTTSNGHTTIGCTVNGIEDWRM